MPFGRCSNRSTNKRMRFDLLVPRPLGSCSPGLPFAGCCAKPLAQFCESPPGPPFPSGHNYYYSAINMRYERSMISVGFSIPAGEQGFQDPGQTFSLVAERLL